VLAGIGGCVGVLAATALLAPANVTLAWALLILGFLGLGVTRHSGAPWRPVRMSLGAACVVATYMFSGLPWPPRGAELGSAVVLALSVVASVTAGVVLERAPHLAAGLLLLLGSYGAFMLVRFGYAVRQGIAVDGYNGPATVLAFVVAACTGAGWIAAVWHARALFRRVSSNDVESGHA
jgi:hypothetical protein